MSRTFPSCNDMVKAYLANQRQGTQSALTRSEVSGGGRKPWRQKGTGRARQGSTRAPQWTHGGIVFGTEAERLHRTPCNKKVKRLAMKSALSSKVAGQRNDRCRLHRSRGLQDEERLQRCSRRSAARRRRSSFCSEVDAQVIASAANIPGVKTAQVNTLNVYDILNADKFIVVKDAVSKIEEVYA